MKDNCKEEHKRFPIVYQFNDKEEFEELLIDPDLELINLLDDDFTLLFIDPKRYRAWLWHGWNTTTRTRGAAAKNAPAIRDKYGLGIILTGVDQGNETNSFNLMIGKEEVEENLTEQNEPTYKDNMESLEFFKTLSQEELEKRILLKLEKGELPEGYERKMVIFNNLIFAYQEIKKSYLGTVLVEPRLFPLEEEIEDGYYLAKNYTPRILFSYGNVILTELLKELKN